ncbi:MAG: hypothetical protein AB7P07_08965 [Hyphomonadaceae bacterium]
MSETVALTPEQVRARKRRNFWLALSIGAFMALVFFVSIAKMTQYSVAGAS